MLGCAAADWATTKAMLSIARAIGWRNGVMGGGEKAVLDAIAQHQRRPGEVDKSSRSTPIRLVSVFSNRYGRSGGAPTHGETDRNGKSGHCSNRINASEAFSPATHSPRRPFFCLPCYSVRSVDSAATRTADPSLRSG